MKGPPISTAIIAPSIVPSIILLVPLIDAKKLLRPVFIAPTIGLIANIIKAIKSIPNTGYNNTGFIPSRESGKYENNFLSSNTTYPPTNPASKAPKKPALIAVSEL